MFKEFKCSEFESYKANSNNDQIDFDQQEQNETIKQMLEINSKSDLQFDSDFESGNLDMAVQQSKNEFDLFLRIDSNSKGHS